MYTYLQDFYILMYTYLQEMRSFNFSVLRLESLVDTVLSLLKSSLRLHLLTETKQKNK